MLTWFLTATACRIGEALGLKWGAVNFEDKRVWFVTARYLGEEHLCRANVAVNVAVTSDKESFADVSC